MCNLFPSAVKQVRVSAEKQVWVSTVKQVWDSAVKQVWVSAVKQVGSLQCSRCRTCNKAGSLRMDAGNFSRCIKTYINQFLFFVFDTF